MKNLIMIIFIFSLGLGIFVRCSAEETELRWKNDQTNNVTDIKWTNYNDETDTEWSGTYAQDEKTPFKTVSVNNGKGYCNFGGGEAEISIDGTNSNTTTLSAGSNELDISGEVTK